MNEANVDAFTSLHPEVGGNMNLQNVGLLPHTTRPHNTEDFNVKYS
jgi:hypothetical protein